MAIERAEDSDAQKAIDLELAKAGVGISHNFGGGTYVKETFIPAGVTLTQHMHDHDHLSYLVSGAVMLTIGDEARPMQAPQAVKIKAGKAHEIYAYTASVWLCIWATDCEDPAKVDGVLHG